MTRNEAKAEAMIDNGWIAHDPRFAGGVSPCLPDQWVLVAGFDRIPNIAPEQAGKLYWGTGGDTENAICWWKLANPPAEAPMPKVLPGYTIAEIDRAILAIAGERTVYIMQQGGSRPHAMLRTAEQAWINQYPEDEHTRVLRAALTDLNTKGVLLPRDGVWPV